MSTMQDLKLFNNGEYMVIVVSDEFYNAVVKPNQETRSSELSMIEN